MITDKTLDEAMVEAARFLKAAKALRDKRTQATKELFASDHQNRSAWLVDRQCEKEHAACKRASLDLTRKLAELRAGR